METKPKVLLIEDDASIAAGLKKELEAEGYDVVIATRGDEGSGQARAQAFDVVITDFKMPGLSGLELIGQLHTARPGLPIIMITAFGTQETVLQAVKLGAYSCLAKPFEMAELLELLAQALASS